MPPYADRRIIRTESSNEIGREDHPFVLAAPAHGQQHHALVHEIAERVGTALWPPAARLDVSRLEHADSSPE